MSKVRFLTDYTFTPPEDRRVSVKYLAGRGYRGVRKIALQLAIAAGAVAAPKPPPAPAVATIARRRRSAKA